MFRKKSCIRKFSQLLLPLSIVNLNLLFSSIVSSNVSAVEANFLDPKDVSHTRQLNNPYNLDEQEFHNAVKRGFKYATEYPIKSTGLLFPFEPIRSILDGENSNALQGLLQKIIHNATPYSSLDDFFSWIGLPENQQSESIKVSVSEPSLRLGVTLIDTDLGKGLTVGCPACHSTNLFGKTILGMTNRFPRSYELFALGKKASALVSPQAFQLATAANDDETLMYAHLRKAFLNIGGQVPSSLGLDASISHIAVLLSLREPDEWASLSEKYRKKPRYEILRHDAVADSKPSVWWNVKYKNRWLSDGSLVGGNPVFTNLLWNELGHGVDLKNFDAWLDNNSQIVADLTTAVFANEAPLYTDFFQAETVDLEKAKRGQKVYLEYCGSCHGDYTKAWEMPNADQMSISDLLKTVEVDYPRPTRVRDVGTDPARYLGSKSLVALNNLKLQQKWQTKIVPQQGYVPPPLIGIWARWPYMHNNSIPNLCVLLTRTAKRPKKFYMGEALDRDRDYDQD
ncbi:MAG: hypothetical protein KBD78_15380, partial [Oligoflexales bacterium]|nr:hypothetical protein [Oligoflexales bacterium]